MKLYYCFPETGDGCDVPTTPDPMPLEQVGGHLNEWLARYSGQGYFLNCRQQRVPLDKISFTVAYSGIEVDANSNAKVSEPEDIEGPIRNDDVVTDAVEAHGGCCLSIAKRGERRRTEADAQRDNITTPVLKALFDASEVL